MEEFSCKTKIVAGNGAISHLRSLGARRLFLVTDPYFTKSGTAQAVVNAIHEIDPTREVKIARADGLEECKKLLLMAKAGKYDGYLLEGMACPGGCVAGAGTLLPVDLAANVVGRYQKETDRESPLDSAYRDTGKSLD